jgi:hypothetical protein
MDTPFITCADPDQPCLLQDRLFSDEETNSVDPDQPCLLQDRLFSDEETNSVDPDQMAWMCMFTGFPCNKMHIRGVKVIQCFFLTVIVRKVQRNKQR